MTKNNQDDIALMSIKQLEKDDIIYNDLIIDKQFDENKEINCTINGEDIKISFYFEKHSEVNDSILVNAILVIGVIGLKEDTIEILKNNPLRIQGERYFTMFTYGGENTIEKGFITFFKQSFQSRQYLPSFINRFVLFTDEEKKELISLTYRTRQLKMSKYDFQKFGRLCTIFSYCESNDLRELKKADALRYLSDFIIIPATNYKGVPDFHLFNTDEFYYLAIKGYAEKWRILLKQALYDTLIHLLNKVFSYDENKEIISKIEEQKTLTTITDITNYFKNGNDFEFIVNGETLLLSLSDDKGIIAINNQNSYKEETIEEVQKNIFQLGDRIYYPNLKNNILMQNDGYIQFLEKNTLFGLWLQLFLKGNKKFNDTESKNILDSLCKIMLGNLSVYDFYKLEKLFLIWQRLGDDSQKLQEKEYNSKGTLFALIDANNYGKGFDDIIDEIPAISYFDNGEFDRLSDYLKGETKIILDSLMNRD